MWAPLLSRVSLAEAPGWRQPAGSVVLEGQAEVAGGDWLGWVLRLQGGGVGRRVVGKTPTTQLMSGSSPALAFAFAFALPTSPLF